MNVGVRGGTKMQDCPSLVRLPDSEAKKSFFHIVPIEAVTGYNSD